MGLTAGSHNRRVSELGDRPIEISNVKITEKRLIKSEQMGTILSILYKGKESEKE